MPNKCLVYGCPTGNKRKGDEKNQTLKFPRDPLMRQKWYELVYRDRPTPELADPRICVIHFQPNDFVPETDTKNRVRKYKRLRSTAVPSINMIYNDEIEDFDDKVNTSELG